MGRASKPTRRIHAARVRAGDVVLLRSPDVPSTRWLMVDHATAKFVGPPHVWSGRWAFGADAGQWTIVVARDEAYVVKHESDARRVAEHLWASAQTQE